MDYESLLGEYAPTQTPTFSVLLYGASGSGKTHLAGTFPEPFFIDADRGMRSLEMECPYLRLKDAATPFTLVLNVLQDALAGRGPWAPDKRLGKIKTIVIDSYTALIDDYMLPETMKEGKRNWLNEKATFDEYGKIKSRMTALASIIKDLSMKYFVVSTALVEEEKDENSGELIGKPLMTGKYRDKVQADFDETYFLRSATDMVSGSTKYMAHAQPYKFYRAKTRLTTMKTMEDPSFDKIQKTLKIFKKSV